jgi:hypothetical protein
MTRYNAKPGVDWLEIERRVRAGDSFRSIEQDHDVSHQAISQRATKEGWTEEARLQLAAKEFKVVEANGKATVGAKLAVIQALENGVLLKTAAGAAGISERTLREWRETDAAFAAECEKAVDRFIQANLELIQAAAKRGDWKAAQWMLGKHPKSKADYAEEKAGGNGNTVNIVLSIPKPGQAIELIEVIDTQAEPPPALPKPEQP